MKGKVAKFNYSLGETSINLISFAALGALAASAAYNLHIYNQIYSKLFPIPWGIVQRLLNTSIWGLVQLIEAFPLLLSNELAFMALVAIALAVFPRAPEAESDHPSIARLRDRYNSFPERFLYAANVLAGLVFILDLIGVFSHFEPITFRGGLPSINVWLSIQTLATVFIVQALVWVALWSWGGRWLVQSARTSAMKD